MLDEDSFRARAFNNAARVLDGLSEPLESLLDSSRLKSIKGIGPGVAAAILEISQRGTFSDLETAAVKVPAGVLDLLKVDGLGPKKARTLWIDAKIASLPELKSAITTGEIAKLSGFGEKTAVKFLDSIDFLQEVAGRHWRHHARRIIDKIRGELPATFELVVGGSYARGLETVRDLDILIIADETQIEHVESLLRASPHFQWQEFSAKFWSGRADNFDLELKVIPPALAPLKRLLFTGSKVHFAALQNHAKKRGILLTPDDFCDAAGRPLRINSEADIYQALGLEPLPAALRESEQLHAQGTVSFPEPVQLRDIRGLLHNHSTWSDGKNTLREMAEAMITHGYEFFGIADHSKAAAYANGLTAERVREQWKEVDQLNRELAPFRILKGIECDILADGSLDFDDDLLSGFDYVVASIHSGFNMTAEQATARLCRALDNPHVDILGHPTGRLLLERRGYPVDHERLIECAAANGKAIELNANPHRLDLDWRWLSTCIEREIPVPINPDAHSINGLLDVQYGVDVAAKGPLTPALCPSTWKVEQILDWCNSHGAKR